MTKRQPRMQLEPHWLVFIDETSTNTKMIRPMGRAGHGERLRATAPFGRSSTQTFIAGLRCWGLMAPRVLDGPMNRAAFNTYIKTRLAPTLNRGDVVILDNLPAHKSPEATRMLKDKGAWFMFLPPCSPDLNPIKMALSELKARLRAAGARTCEELWKAVGSICDLFIHQEC